MDSFKVVLPQGIDWDALFKNEKPQIKELAKMIVSCIYLKITYKWDAHINKGTDEPFDLNDVQIRLNAKILKETYGSNYKKVLSILHQKVLFKYPYTPTRWVNGKKEQGKSFGYSINPKWWYCQPEIHEINCGYTIIKNSIKRLRKPVSSAERKAFNKYKHTYKFYKAGRFSVDFDELQQFLDESDMHIADKFYSLSIACKLVNGDYRAVNHTETDGRFHTIITQLPKNIRKFIKYDNQPLAEVDLSNSVLYILASILNNTTLYNKLVNSNILYMIPDLLKSVDIIELELFCKKCFTGSIYDVFIDKLIPKYTSKELFSYSAKTCKEVYNYSCEMNRAIIKKRLLAFLFAPNGDYEDVGEAFEELFPKVYGLIWKLKEKNHKWISHLLFSCEAYCMHKFSKEINNSKGGRMPLFLLHDCIVMQKGNEEYVEEYLLKSFQKFTGQPPTLKIKYWDE